MLNGQRDMTLRLKVLTTYDTWIYSTRLDEYPLSGGDRSPAGAPRASRPAGPAEEVGQAAR